MSSPSVLGSSAVMAAGTVVSRFSGYVRSLLLAAALGLGLHADVFTIANTIPNMLYILLAGGVFNAVLVPQLVRAMKNDADGGEAYTNRIITLSALFLAGVTAVLVIAAPLVMALYLDDKWQSAALAEERESVITLARYCLPQVFFYGMFVLVGQILNSRGKFGPMMWAPIANNLVSMAVLIGYLVVFGPSSTGGYSDGEELLLGLGSTLGIVLQLLILLPYLKAAGFTYRPRFDFRGTGLGHTFRLGTWTVLFVIVNQIAYTVVVRLASSGTAESSDGTGYTIYAGAFLLVMVPHAIITVSLATAILPSLSAHASERRLPALASDLASTLRTSLVVILPFVALLPVISLDLSRVVWGYGAAAEDYGKFAPTVAWFAPGILFFTLHYLMLRGFYALERTRTVFWVQCIIGVVNVVVGTALVAATSPQFTTPALAIAYACAYGVGALCSYFLLRGVLGGLQTGQLFRFLSLAVPAALVAGMGAYAASSWIHHAMPTDQATRVQTVLSLAAVTAIGALLFGLSAWLLRIREVTDVLSVVTRRLRVPRAG